MQFQLKNGTMFDTDNPICPNCGGEMWDNRQSKKNPKMPDFRCKNKECKDDKGYQTGVYIPKPKKGAPALAPAQAKPPVAAPAQAVARPATPIPAPVQSKPVQNYGKQDYGNSVPPSMYGAWAMNLVIAFVEKGQIASLNDAITAYRDVLQGVGEAIAANKQKLDVKNPPQERQITKPAPVTSPVQAPVAQPAPSPEALPDPIDQIAADMNHSAEISLDSLTNLDF